MKYGYARVSTIAQATNGNSLESQERQLKEAGADEIFVDHFTGTEISRPEFDKLRAKLKSGDTLIVTKLDRFARSVGQASDLITHLIDSGVTINVLNLGVLSNDSVSILMRNILLSFAQFERDMIVQRTQEGKAIARSHPGYRDGRPRKFSQIQIDHAMKLLHSYSFKQVSEMTGISMSTLAREKRRILKGE
ncbi:MAG: recombinase family protein [Eubacterium sp.]